MFEASFIALGLRECTVFLYAKTEICFNFLIMSILVLLLGVGLVIIFVIVQLLTYGLIAWLFFLFLGWDLSPHFCQFHYGNEMLQFLLNKST